MSTDLIGAAETYTNVLTWLAGIPATLLENERGEHKNEQSTNSAASIDVSGFTMGGFTITLTAAAGAGFDSVMNPASDPLRLDPAKGATVLMSGSCDQFAWTNPITISKLQFKKTSNYSQIFFANATTGGLIDQCIGLVESGSAGGLIRCNSSGAVNLDRSLLYSKTNIPGLHFAGINLVARNTLFANLPGGSTGFMSNYSAAYARNCPIMGYTTACSGTSAATSANNATDLSALSGTGFDAGTPQLNVVKTSAFENFTAGTEDFRLKSGSVLIGAGTATDAPSADIFGRAWNGGTPDIGPFRAATGGGGDSLLRPPMVRFQPVVAQ